VFASLSPDDVVEYVCDNAMMEHVCGNTRHQCS